MAKSEMVRKTIYLTPAQAQWLEQTAQSRGVSESQVIRELIDRQLAQDKSDADGCAAVQAQSRRRTRTRPSAKN